MSNRPCAVLVTLTVLAVSAMESKVVYQLPFASTGNIIELVVANESPVAVSQVRIHATNIPSWLRFVATERTLQAIDAHGEERASFSFSVERSAPVNQEQHLRFRISIDGQSWTKEIAVVVAPPEKFELFQNYPNPFNPSTTISYQLPVPGHVTLKVYNLLGQEIATLVDGEQRAGYHQTTFDARGLASGVYVYQLTAAGTKGDRAISRRAMVILK